MFTSVIWMANPAIRVGSAAASIIPRCNRAGDEEHAAGKPHLRPPVLKKDTAANLGGWLISRSK
jgi:hypothetical protein